MAKELMEIGGFITSGAEIVNHDASLSGNGTVDSPLGLNNETLIWSGNATVTATTAISTNEPYTNFDYIKVFGRTMSDQYERMYGEFVPTTTSGYIPFMLTFPAGDNNTLRLASFLFQTTNDDNTKFIVAKGKIWNLSNNSVSTGTPAATITRIVGINRKAQ